MRHIVIYDTEKPAWAVVDTKGSNMVISFHETKHAATEAARHEEQNWPELAGDF